MVTRIKKEKKTEAKKKAVKIKAAKALVRQAKSKPAAKQAGKVGTEKVTMRRRPAATKKKEAVVSESSIKQKTRVISDVVTQPVLEKPSTVKVTPTPKKAAPVRIIPPEEAKEVKKEIIEETRPVEVAPSVVELKLKELELKLPISVKDLAVKMQEKPSVVIKALMDKKIMIGINQTLEESLVKEICEKFGFRVTKALDEEELALQAHKALDRPEILQARPPIVTLMGHVDHGKTSLLDAIRKTKLVEAEHGGITQHIGAYRVELTRGKITFLDTPGHEAFTAMRARGAHITDIVVLVVAADDGVMPQTQEAIDHARAAGVPIIVAINKIDKPQANIDRVKKQLSELGLMAEDWGGKTITVAISAKTGEGIDDLLEMILLEAEMLELKANANRLACGVVVEAKLTKGRGPVSTLLIQNGTLRLNDNIIVGSYYGKVRAMFNDRGQSVNEVPPSFPVEILGISGVPQAGEQFFVIEDEKLAKEIALRRQEQERQRQMRTVKRISLEDLYSQIKEGKIKELKMIIKADVQGSLGAIKETLKKLDVSEIKLDIIHEGVGSINTSDAILAVASNALVLGFNVTVDERARELAAKEGLDIRTYNIIYELANDIKSAIEGMLTPKLKKVFLGRVEVRKVFRLSRAGTVAGCFVVKGKISRNSLVDLVRNGEVVFEGKVSSLKRFKDDVREAAEGFECGIVLANFEGIQEGDIIEAYEIETIARKL